jgi:hypothetical protein
MWGGLSSTGFSLWGLVLARTKFHRLKPVLLKPSNLFELVTHEKQYE